MRLLKNAARSENSRSLSHRLRSNQLPQFVSIIDRSRSHLRTPAARWFEVLGFEVTMSDALSMRGRESGRYLLRIIQSRAHRLRTFFESRSQFFAFQQLHHDERRTAVMADVVNRENVGVIESRCRASLLLKPPQTVFVDREPGGQDLDGDRAVQPSVERAIDLPHSARADLSDDAVMRQSGVGFEFSIHPHQNYSSSFARQQLVNSSQIALTSPPDVSSHQLST